MMMRNLRSICAASLAVLLLACSCEARVRQYRAEVVNAYPHSEDAYTQGLFFWEGRLYESTGMYGSSTFRQVDIATGKALRQLDFDKKYFVEGSCVLDGELFILTWESRVAFIYDAETLAYKSSWSYPREGWGLTTDGRQLVASDGSSRLYFMDKEFRVQRTVTVRLDGRPVPQLNELEYIDGKIWANVYTTDTILIIDPASGIVEATVDCAGLLPPGLRDRRTDVLNGIAWNPRTRQVFLTGKYWKRMFEIRLKEIKTDKDS